MNSSEEKSQIKVTEDIVKMSAKVVDKEPLHLLEKSKQEPTQVQEDSAQSLNDHVTKDEVKSSELDNILAVEKTVVHDVWNRFVWLITLGWLVAHPMSTNRPGEKATNGQVDWDNHEARRRWNTFYLFTSLMVWACLAAIFLSYVFDFSHFWSHWHHSLSPST